MEFKPICFGFRGLSQSCLSKMRQTNGVRQVPHFRLIRAQRRQMLLLPERFREGSRSLLFFRVHIDCPPSLSVTFWSLFSHTVAGHLPDGHREGPDCCHSSGFTLPCCQHLLAHLVLTQPFSQVATAGSALSDLLWHVWLHGCCLHR